MTLRTAPAPPEVRLRAGLPVLAWPVFDPFDVDVMVTTRQGGVSAGPYASLNLSLSVGDEAVNVAENRRRAAAAIGASLEDFVFARQVHGTGARVVSAVDRGRGTLAPQDAIGGVDALVTSGPGTVLAVLAADCVPIVLYDPAVHVLACAHAGWRGTVGHVAQAALSAMRSLGASPQRVIAGLGPAAGPDSYQVGEEVAAQVRAGFGAAAGQVMQPAGSGRWLLDLRQANRLSLAQAGVPGEQIHATAIPTGPGPGLFYSHRDQRPCGRFALVAKLRPRGDR